MVGRAEHESAKGPPIRRIRSPDASGLVEAVASLAPGLVLDVGCGCGEFTRTLVSSAARVVAVDVASPLVRRWTAPPPGPAIDFCVMDARALGFHDGTFPVVLERDSLHHIQDWERALEEMFRVSSRQVVIEEPIDDLRSDAKRNTIAAHHLYVEVQREVGYPHGPHIEPGILVGVVERLGAVQSVEWIERDDATEFDGFFEGFARFAARSAREDYWMTRLRTFRDDSGGAALCANDSFRIVALKDRSGGPAPCRMSA